MHRCSVCHEPLGDDFILHATKRTRHQQRAARECGHAFHAPCLARWAVTCLAQARVPSCPMCKGDLSEVLESKGLLVRRSAAGGGARVSGRLLRDAIREGTVELPVDAHPGLAPADVHTHAFLREFGLKHEREVAAGERRFEFRFDVIDGRTRTLSICAELWYVMDAPMITSTYVAVGPPPRPRMTVGVLRAVHKIAHRALLTGEALAKLRALTLRPGTRWFDVTVPDVVGEALIAGYAGRYAREVSHMLHGRFEFATYAGRDARDVSHMLHGRFD